MCATARAILVADNAVSASYEGTLDQCREQQIAGIAVAGVLDPSRRLRLEAATQSYFLSLSDDELRRENELGNALSDSTGLVDFNE